jgi:hypothetical protein
MGSAELAEVAPALCRNTSIEVLDIARNSLNGMDSAVILRDILRSDKTITTLDLSRKSFWETPGAVECITDRLSAILLNCAFRDDGISTLAQTRGSWNKTLQKLTLDTNSITSTGVGVLLETMEQSSHHITDLDFQHNPIGNEGASLLVRALGKNALTRLSRLSLSTFGIGDDGCTALVSALKQNTSLLELDLRYKPFPWFQ